MPRGEEFLDIAQSIPVTEHGCRINNKVMGKTVSGYVSLSSGSSKSYVDSKPTEGKPIATICGVIYELHTSKGTGGSDADQEESKRE